MPYIGDFGLTKTVAMVLAQLAQVMVHLWERRVVLLKN